MDITIYIYICIICLGAVAQQPLHELGVVAQRLWSCDTLPI